MHFFCICGYPHELHTVCVFSIRIKYVDHALINAHKLKSICAYEKNLHGHSNGYPVDCYDYLSTGSANKEGEDFTRSDGNLDRRLSPHRLWMEFGGRLFRQLEPISDKNYSYKWGFVGCLDPSFNTKIFILLFVGLFDGQGHICKRVKGKFEASRNSPLGRGRLWQSLEQRKASSLFVP